MLHSIKQFLSKDVKWPVGLATSCVFLFCLFSYYKLSPFFGVLLMPDAFAEPPQDILCWFLWAVKMGFLGGFCHHNLSHLMGNMMVTLPCMLIVEKHRGPIVMIALYCLMSMVGSVFMFHMLMEGGIGSSCATFGMAVVALFLMTKGVSRVLLFVPFIVILIEAAQWWLGAMGDPIGHLGHVGGGLVGFIYCLASKDKEVV